MSLFQNLTITSLCIHEIFKRESAGVEKTPKYGDQVFCLEPAARQYMSERLVNALGDNSSGVLMIIKSGEERGTFPAVLQCFEQADDVGFLARSKEMAAKLSSLQARTNIPGGMVLVVKGTTSVPERQFICIIKAEIHSGFTKKIATNGNITLEFAKDLFLTPEQRLFKLGIYIKKLASECADGIPEAQKFEVLVFDSQMSNSNPTGAAIYFTEGFLGCERPMDNNVLTEMFYMNTREFISRSDMTEKKKNEVSISLYSYIKLRNSDTIQSSEFANQYVLQRLQDSYLAYMRDAGVPERPIHRDLSLLKNSFERKRISFKSGLKISGTPDAFKHKVKFGVVEADGSQNVTITDLIDRQS